MLFFEFPEDARWNDERECVEFSVILHPQGDRSGAPPGFWTATATATPTRGWPPRSLARPGPEASRCAR